MKTWRDLDIDTRGQNSGELKTTCPQCSRFRKKSNYRCLNVNLDKHVWHCWHCAWSGNLAKGEEVASNPHATPRIYQKPVYRRTPLPQNILNWFAGRGIPEDVLARQRISCGPVYFPQVEQELPAIQFPYFRNGEVLNVKYRGKDKMFRMSGGAERILYGLDDIEGDTVIVVEGEMDALSLHAAGYHSVISVPDGAPAPTAKSYESKFDFLTSAESLLQSLKKIIIAVDNDAPGLKLGEELSRRFGPERCLVVDWPEDCKDANDVLVKHGAEKLCMCVENAHPWPIRGIIPVETLHRAIIQLYQHGITRGTSTGWSKVDDHYTIRRGDFTVITGIPSHGKTAWASDLMVNLAKNEGWRMAVYSPENYPMERYAACLIQQYTRFPFTSGPQMRLPEADLAKAMNWVTEHFSFLMPEEEEPTISHLLDLAKIQVYRQGINGLLLDPWNEMEHSRERHLTETEYISKALSQIRRFARHHNVHVWIVAHPTKMSKATSGEYEGKYPPPTPYDISGSAHFRNKADNCITIWRDAEADNNTVEVHIQKIRYKEIGKLGVVRQGYDQTCGFFTDIRELDEPTQPASYKEYTNGTTVPTYPTLYPFSSAQPA